VPAATPGLTVAERIETISPHPLATLRFEGCEFGDDHRVGAEGEGFKLAMRTLDIFRVSVAAAAVGFARRALRETLHHANTRAMFGATLSTQPLAQAIIGDMTTDLDAAALLTYRAAWQRDTTDVRTTAVAAMAKLGATEFAQTIIDRAVQLHGGLGVRTGSVVERLYRDIRALRIYEGATEVQRLLVGRETLKDAADPGAR
jgi:acyl-CoA dehydrogenase